MNLNSHLGLLSKFLGKSGLNTENTDGLAALLPQFHHITHLDCWGSLRLGSHVHNSKFEVIGPASISSHHPSGLLCKQRKTK
jgi:hypothetical protein